MCNHYRDEEEEQLDRLRAILPGLALPAALPKLPMQLYPKYPARVIVQEGGVPIRFAGTSSAHEWRSG
jgi:hypothetical protein